MIGLLSLIPDGRMAQGLIVAAVIASAVGGVAYAKHRYDSGLRDEGRAEVRAEWDAATRLATDTQRETDRLNRFSKEKAIEERTKKIMATVAAADALRVVADGLRNTSERSIAAARESPAACLVSADTHAQLFASCEREYRGLAEKADGHAADAKALMDAWPN